MGRKFVYTSAETRADVTEARIAILTVDIAGSVVSGVWRKGWLVSGVFNEAYRESFSLSGTDATDIINATPDNTMSIGDWLQKKTLEKLNTLTTLPAGTEQTV